MVQAVATALDGIVNKEEGVAEQRGRDLIGTIDQEFGPKDQIQAAESFLDKEHQQQQLDLMNAMYAERSRVLKKLVFEMMNQKQAEYDLIRSEYDPQYHFLKDKKSKGSKKKVIQASVHFSASATESYSGGSGTLAASTEAGGSAREEAAAV